MLARTTLYAVAPLLIATACSSNTDSAPANAAASTAVSAVDPSVVRRVIDSTNASFADALKRGDTTAALGSHYAQDAVVMMPNEQAWRGRDGVRKGLVGFLSQISVKEAKLGTEDVIIDGDLAVETGTYEWTVVPMGGKEIKDKGKYMTVWKRQSDGSWKIVRDINNSDLPLKM